MIPELPHNGTPHNRALLEDLFGLLSDHGFDINWLYQAGMDIDKLVQEITALLGQHHR